MQQEGLGKFKTIIDLIGSRIRDLLTCSIMPQLLCYRMPPTQTKAPKCIVVVCSLRPPLWSSGQSSWLQIRRPGFDSRHYQKKVVGLERGPHSLMSTTEELLDKKVEAPV
jgi:hypothetical protein